MRGYQERVLRLCTSLLSDPALAEDAAQEIFLKAYKALAGFRQDSSFSTWLYRIAANHCKDLLRKRTREKTESWEALLEEHGDTIQKFLASPKDLRSSASNAEIIDAVLSHLSADHRLLLTLREVQGLSYKELAETLHCTVDAIKARLRRARQTIQDRLRHFLQSENV